MSVIAKINTLQQSFQNDEKVLLKEEDLISLFGENYKNEGIEFDTILTCFIFEEENELYFTTLQDEKVFSKNKEYPYSLILNSQYNVGYTKIHDAFIKFLKQNKNYFEEKATEENAAIKLKRINEILDHPSIRLKQLFLHGKRF